MKTQLKNHSREPLVQAANCPGPIEKQQYKLLKYLLVLGMILSVYMLTIQPVLAHGEKNLEPYVRMRTIQWYDVQWSKQTIQCQR